MNNDTSFDIIQDSNPVQTVAPTNKEDNDNLSSSPNRGAKLVYRERTCLP